MCKLHNWKYDQLLAIIKEFMFFTLLGKTITSCLEKLMPYEPKKRKRHQNGSICQTKTNHATSVER